ncbi:glucan biosynthesis protein [Methylovirgula sp. 4M-Z18]|uniref:glucan biosynthesis protein n=1 Tax=Methylovirgula sp. 4M-Z18 TaxID=2293567 RepID=UPI000E2E97D0|nr:glucan biosynthesis protein D [Methylovirgula sp. 4M-Z18]RFB77996.1 glucan biosynthesis protein D [Methylovirgula sp. 4M-Z18]
MTEPMDRRHLIKAAGASFVAGLAASGGTAALAAEGLKFGPSTPFSFEVLKERAAAMARQDYVGPDKPSPEILDKIDYEAHGKIHYRTEMALFANGPGKYPVTFFHLGKFFKKAVGMNVVTGNQSRRIIYSANYFDMPADSPAKQLPEGSGFAGFRIQEPRDGRLDWHKNDWVAFLGASYFRAIGQLYQYGLSARGLALDVAVAGKAEEFPDFTEFYIEPGKNDGSITVYALLDGPSVTGAYRFVMTRSKGVIMEIEQSLNLRADIARFGIAPLTSMYWFSETMKPTAIDWRPEVHDSDGLAMWTGSGERLWRPLNNPPRIMASAFQDINPRGFGLLQRDRAFDHYQDGVHYERRPSLWVEPLAPWGKGSVQLVEIPTDDEIHDNIVAQWVPAEPATAGQTFNLKYRLFWLDGEPYPAVTLGICTATRLGNGGQPGQPRPKGVRKFMIEFLGGPLQSIPFGVKPEAVLSASRGTFSYVFTEAVPDGVPGHWRAQFDLTVDGSDPVEMRCFLKTGDRVLTETWLYQYHPF